MSSQQIVALHAFHRTSSKGWYPSSPRWKVLMAVSNRQVVDVKVVNLFQGSLRGQSSQFLDFVWTSLHSTYWSAAVIPINTIGAGNLLNFSQKKSWFSLSPSGTFSPAASMRWSQPLACPPTKWDWMSTPMNRTRESQCWSGQPVPTPSRV